MKSKDPHAKLSSQSPGPLMKNPDSAQNSTLSLKREISWFDNDPGWA